MDKIKVIFIQDTLDCGGTAQALYDLSLLLDNEKFDVTVFSQKPGAAWDGKFRDAGIRLIYDYSCRKPTINPFIKLRNIWKKVRTESCYRRDGEGLLDVIHPGADIVVSYSMWDYPRCGFASGAKSVKFIHGNMSTNTAFRDLILRDHALLPRYDRIVCFRCRSTGICGYNRSEQRGRDPLQSHQQRYGSPSGRRAGEFAEGSADCLRSGTPVSGEGL